MVVQPINCSVLLSINANGKIFNPREDFPGIRATSEISQTRNICQRYAEEYFKLNRENIEFLPGRDIRDTKSAGQLLINITIQPVSQKSESSGRNNSSPDISREIAN
ncbi:MAG: hypothetical protein HC908_03030 [Calothrix sp. SM1_7_51]|nr:hypothetical protein [Calothrix sp. SM1_7_51]